MQMCTQKVRIRLMKCGKLMFGILVQKAAEIKIKVCKASNSLSKRVKLLPFCQTKKSMMAELVEQTTLEYENYR